MIEIGSITRVTNLLIMVDWLTDGNGNRWVVITSNAYPDAAKATGRVPGLLEIRIVLDDDCIFQKDLLLRRRASADVDGALKGVASGRRFPPTLLLAHSPAAPLRHIETVFFFPSNERNEISTNGHPYFVSSPTTNFNLPNNLFLFLGFTKYDGFLSNGGLLRKGNIKSILHVSLCLYFMNNKFLKNG